MTVIFVDHNGYAAKNCHPRIPVDEWSPALTSDDRAADQARSYLYYQSDLILDHDEIPVPDRSFRYDR